MAITPKNMVQDHIEMSDEKRGSFPPFLKEKKVLDFGKKERKRVIKVIAEAWLVLCSVVRAVAMAVYLMRF